jgi:hypothetical protein
MNPLLGYYQRRPETVHAVKHEGVHRETIARLGRLNAQLETLPHAHGFLELVDQGSDLLVRPGEWIVWGGLDRCVRVLSAEDFRRYYVPA